MDKHAEEIIEELQSKKENELLKQIKELEPNPFTWIISFVMFVAGLFLLNYFTGNSIVEDKYYLLIAVVFVALSFNDGANRKIHKRVSLLTKFVINVQRNQEKQ